MRRQLPFLPSLVTSAAINLAVFSALSPIQPDPAAAAAAPRWRVQRLSRVELVRPSLADPARPTVVALPAPAPRPREASRPATRRRAESPRQRPAGRDGRARGGGAPGETRVAQARPATGGDGTRSTPMTGRAGGGDPLTATPREPGDPRLRQAGPALGGTREPALGASDVRDAPPLLIPGQGLRGGTPTAPSRGADPLAGTAGSGDQPAELAPRTLAGFEAPLAPTTPGPRLREKAGPGLPDLPSAPVKIAAAVVERGRSGGGGGTATIPGLGGGGPAVAGEAPDRSGGGGGSGLNHTGPRPGGTELGAGPGGTGGGGNGLAEVGNGVEGSADGTAQRPASLGAPSVVARPAGGEAGGAAVRPGKRTPGPGGAPAAATASPVRAAGRPGRGGSGGGSGGGRGTGDGDGPGRGAGDGDGDGGAATAVGHGGSDGGEFTGVVIDTLALKWHHYPTSFDLRIGSVDGPMLGSFGIVRYPSVPAAKASDRVLRKGRRNVVVIRPLEIEYVVQPGQGARQRLVISAADAALLKRNGLLRDPSRVLTVYRKNYG